MYLVIQIDFLEGETIVGPFESAKTRDAWRDAFFQQLDISICANVWNSERFENIDESTAHQITPEELISTIKAATVPAKKD